MIHSFNDPLVKSVVSFLVAAIIGLLLWIMRRHSVRIDVNSERIRMLEIQQVDRDTYDRDLKAVYSKIDAVADVFRDEHHITRAVVAKSNDDIITELRRINEQSNRSG